MIDIVCRQRERRQSVCLFFVGDIEELVKQDANNGQQKAKRRWPSHHEGQYEERNEGK